MPIFSLGERQPELEQDHFIAPGAMIIGSVTLKQSANIWFNVVIRGDGDQITVGERSNVQDNSVLHADPGKPLQIGCDVTVGHGAMLHGCSIGDGSLVGIHAVVLNQAVVGKGCIIGANSLIPEGKVIPEGSLVMGTPGKVIRILSEQERAGLIKTAQGYVARALRYRLELTSCPLDHH
jgi:carbonic anhydrase/acetyltransferase-like protein (isoleucine patch superfamily)